MRRSTPMVICCALILLFGVTEAIASGLAAPPPPDSKLTGPAVRGTILIFVGDPLSSREGGMFAIRLTKGNLSSGAIVLSSRVQDSRFNTTPGNIEDQFLGGENTPGGLLSPYFDDSSVLIEIFRELGIAISLDPNDLRHPLYQPVIVDVDDAVCSPADCTGTLSLDVKIKFAFPKKK